jgi:hypothetical protein
MENKSLRTAGNFPRRTSICDLHADSHLLHMRDLVIRFLQDLRISTSPSQDKAKPSTENARGLNLGEGGFKPTSVQVTKLPL